MIVGNCCHGCTQRNTTPSISTPSRTGGATLSTGFRRPAPATTRRVRFEAPSLPQRLRASAVGLARAAIATPDLNALSGWAAASRGNDSTSKLAAGTAVEQPSAWSQNSNALSGRPYWEQESSCASIYSDPYCSSFRSALQPADAAHQSAFHSFSAQQPSLLSGPSKASSKRLEWREEFLTTATSNVPSSLATSGSGNKGDIPATLSEDTQDQLWDGELKGVVQKLLPGAATLLDNLEHDPTTHTAKSTTFDANTVKRLRMILQHLAYTAPSTAMLSVR